ncbi:MAG: DUF547 domain-containing protein [Flavobacteriaceae bacterium]|nr:DUF547 domain-containing protein [Flavobacteriaceae bacterium]
MVFFSNCASRDLSVNVKQDSYIAPFESSDFTSENTLDEQLEQLEEEDLSIDLSGSAFIETDQMTAEEIETFITNSSASAEAEQSIHQSWDDLLSKHVSRDGLVNYSGFKSDWKDLRNYIENLGVNIPDNTYNRSDKLAYWINAYNALTVDLILRNYPLKSIKDINGPWNQRLWKLGDKWYNLDEIEHQILRKMNEPRIHFAIVCASYSCPKLMNKAYLGSKIDDQLTKATEEFLSDKNRNSITSDALEISKIFQWFAKDFKQNGTLIDFLNRYSGGKISPKAKIRYKTYDWALNE